MAKPLIFIAVGSTGLGDVFGTGINRSILVGLSFGSKAMDLTPLSLFLPKHTSAVSVLSFHFAHKGLVTSRNREMHLEFL